jgi:hypothetical protein
MLELHELCKKYIVVIFTNFDEEVKDDLTLEQLLEQLSRSHLKNSKCWVITKHAKFEALESAGVENPENVIAVVHREESASEQLKEFIQKACKTRRVLAGIHNGSTREVKEDQSRWIRETGGLIREYIHEIDERRSPVWYSFSSLCCDVYEGKSDQFQKDYAKLVAAVISLPTMLSILRHRIAHLFTPIDVDIQGLNESKFRPDYWEKVVAAYRETKPTRVITGARRIKEELGKVANNKQKKVIDKKWKEAEKEFDNMKPLLTALGNGDLDNCIKQADGFRTSLGKFLRILDELDDELTALGEGKK